MLLRSILFLAVPRITRSFDVEVTAEDAGSAELVGSELAAVATFLRISSGVPRFDIEFDGRVFRECLVSGMRTENSIFFTFERVEAIGDPSGPASANPPKEPL